HRLVRARRRAGVDRRLARRSPPGGRQGRTRPRDLPDHLLPARGDDAGRGGRGVALPLPPALRAAEPAPGRDRDPSDRLAWRSRLGAGPPPPRSGLLNQLRGAIGIHPIDWLGDPAWALPALALLAVWKNFGFNMLLFLAGLQAIPERLSEAARLDGAGRWQELWHVTLPMWAPTFVFVGVVTTIGYLQLFAEPYVMTQGGPANSTLSVVLLMYEEGFRWWNLGYGAAVAVVLFALILAVSVVQLWLQRGSLAGGGAR